MKLLRMAVVLATLLAVVPISQPAQAAEEEWEFDGGGWGHGVGLSQFGALGQAQDGRSETQILQHYYTGTSVSDLPGGHWTTEADALWIGIVPNAESVSLTAVGGPLNICHPVETCPPADNGPLTDHTIDPGETWVYEIVPDDTTHCRFRRTDLGNTGSLPCTGAITGLSPSSRVVVNGSQYAHGTIRFTPATSRFHVNVTLGLEEYLYGLAEVPSSWPQEALQAQAIIGRSYAVATASERTSPRLSSCDCHLRATPADQAYAGWAKEGATAGDRWVDAVDATAGKILTHPSSNYEAKIAKAFYSSSNGGASENVEFVWGGAELPWLRSVEDPWSADPSINPLARWTVVVPASKIESAFGWLSVSMVEVTTGPPGAVVRFTGRNGGGTITKDLWGDNLRLFLSGNAYRRDGDPARVSPYVITVRYQGPFLDIAGNIFENAITWLAQEEITLGCNPPANTNYCPNDAVTRGEMAVFISRALGLPAPTADHFTDDAGRFYEGAANRLFEAGITVGCGPDRYCGERSLPRGEMAAFLARILDLPLTETDYFVDDEGSMFEGAINKIAEAQITVGCNPPNNDEFCPVDDVTRGQMAAFFKRVWGP
ncbi:MAG: SpoIID/LytB domain-containing protein [Acidimicrobiia bacterium]